MKKLFIKLTIIVVVGGLCACSNSETKKEKQVKNNTTEEMIGVSYSPKNSEVTSTESEGFGRCSKSGCYCKAFKGRGQTCQNCGHAYKLHY